MKQDKITITNIKSDLNKIAFFYFDKITEWRLTYIVPITIIALLLGIVFKIVFIGLLMLVMGLLDCFLKDFNFTLKIKTFKKRNSFDNRYQHE